MKKLLTAIMLATTIPSIAFATVQIYRRHVLFSHGLSQIELTTEKIGEETNEAIVLTAPNIPDITITSDTNFKTEQNRILLFPGLPAMQDYKFWKIKGSYQGKNFLIFGYTIEVGDDTWIGRNSLTIDIVTIILLLIIPFALRRYFIHHHV